MSLEYKLGLRLVGDESDEILLKLAADAMTQYYLIAFIEDNHPIVAQRIWPQILQLIEGYPAKDNVREVIADRIPETRVFMELTQ